MTEPQPQTLNLDRDVPLAELPVMMLDGAKAVGLGADHAPRDALGRLAREPHLVCHASFLINRLGLAARASTQAVKAASEVEHFDLAELFAFVHPARFTLPTPSGLVRALGLEAVSGAELLPAVARDLLGALGRADYPNGRETAAIATHLMSARWPWARLVLRALREAGVEIDASLGVTGLNVWDRLEDWEERGPRPPPSSHEVSADEAVERLDILLGGGSEDRPAQRAYCGEASAIYAAKDTPGDNTVVLAEAGTGLGKTLGYLAPASIWSDRNAGTVWISTYTKNLQRQLEQESARAYPEPAERARKVVVRKGRENYLCLLNLQDWNARTAPSRGRGTVFAALVARWARATKDGDMVGGDFPAWLMPLFAPSAGAGRGQPVSPLSLGLTDRRGECIYSACPHYRKCFIERVQRKARQADLVIANHALVMAHSAMGATFDALDLKSGYDRPQRLVFDEGHHVFDAADSAFAVHLSGVEMAELRRWLRGPESRNRRGRGLMERLGNLIEDDEVSEEFLADALERCSALPAPGWMQRLQGGGARGAGEEFLSLVHAQVEARTENRGGYAAEAECRPAGDELVAAAERLFEDLGRIADPLRRLAERLNTRLDDDADELDSAERARIEALVRGLTRRAAMLLPGWQHMLAGLGRDANPDFAEWFSIETAYGNAMDVGMHRHWVDPTRPFAEAVLETTDGVLITSATLKDRPPDVPDDWRNAEMRTGAAHLAAPAVRHAHASPFDYAKNARLIVVNDINREAPEQIAAAYRELFLAAGGGALGLFTAIARLRAAYAKLIEPLSAEGLPLYAQHVDPIDVGTLVDLFRADKNACLLGTDAVRDGVDVPGESLRLIVLDRVPWPQPNTLERARRAAFGGNAYQDMIVRLRLRQAFGRLIRTAQDRGAFVLLDSRLATRFTTAFPDTLEVQRIGLVDAIDQVREFLANSSC